MVIIGAFQGSDESRRVESGNDLKPVSVEQVPVCPHL